MLTKMKPLLASPVEDLKALRYPIMISPKLDGIRILVIDGVPLTRNLKPIPNEYVREILAQPEYAGLDAEIIVGDPASPDCFRTTSSGVMSQGGQPDFRIFAFDNIRTSVIEQPFSKRHDYVRQMKADRLVLVEHKYCDMLDDITRYEEQYLEDGYEGAMLRDPEGRYKFGRSTLREGILMKLKRHLDDEALVEGFVERYHNANEAKTNALGYLERSSHVANLIPRGDLGALVVRSSKFQVPFQIGSGFTDADRDHIWKNKGHFLGKLVRYKYLPIGIKDAPRFPVFQGWRDVLDV